MRVRAATCISRAEADMLGQIEAEPIPVSCRNLATDQPIWQPSKERIERANMTAFARQVAEAHGERLRDYGALRTWSVEDPELFWPALWRFADVRASRP